MVSPWESPGILLRSAVPWRQDTGHQMGPNFLAASVPGVPTPPHLTRHCALHSLLRKCHLIPDSSPEALLPQWSHAGYGASPTTHRVLPLPPDPGSPGGSNSLPHRLSRREAGLFRPAQPTGNCGRTVTVGCAAEVSEASHILQESTDMQAPGLGLCLPSSGPWDRGGARN